jgi:hypothetical protein
MMAAGQYGVHAYYGHGCWTDAGRMQFERLIFSIGCGSAGKARLALQPAIIAFESIRLCYMKD